MFIESFKYTYTLIKMVHIEYKRVSYLVWDLLKSLFSGQFGIQFLLC